MFTALTLTQKPANLAIGAVAAVVVVAGVAGFAPTAKSDPQAQPFNGTYDINRGDGIQRTWTINSTCDPTGSCAGHVVLGGDGYPFDLTLVDGRWRFVIPTPTNLTCSAPPVSTVTWSWDPSTLAGTVVDHIIARCGETERDETVGRFTMTKVG